MNPSVRSNAMWWAEVCTACNPPADLTHPTHIRQWHRENATAEPLPADLQDTQINVKPSVDLDQRAAEKVAKGLEYPEKISQGSTPTRPRALSPPWGCEGTGRRRADC